MQLVSFVSVVLSILDQLMERKVERALKENTAPKVLLSNKIVQLVLMNQDKAQATVNNAQLGTHVH